MKFKNSKKGIATSTLAALIILLISFFGIVFILSQVLSDASDEAEVLKCRLSVIQRAMTNVPLLGGSFGRLQCSTLRRNVGVEDSSKEAVMREISDYTTRCWNMFGEGVLRSLKDGESNVLKTVWESANIFGEEKEAFCFVCYDLRIRALDENIAYGEFIDYYERTLYLADSTVSCPAGDVECENLRKDISISSCERRGGDCVQSCDPNTQVQARLHEDWMCKSSRDLRDPVCCLDKNNVYTYESYLRYHSGMGGRLESSQPSFPIEEGNSYAIVYVEPQDSNEVGYIAFGDFEAIEGSGCLQRG